MTLYQVYDTMTGLADQERSEKMAAYMRHQFDFIGIPTPVRRQQEKATFKAAKQTKTVDWDFIDHCWQSSYREHQYLAIDYLVVMEPFLAAIDLAKIEQLVITKAWWDSVDALSEVVRKLVRRLPALKAEMLRWSLEENLWLRRVAILHQLLQKEQMDRPLLEEVLVNNLGSSEFFINKAVGWSLRDYAKTNPQWVQDFLLRYQTSLALLTIREASKYL
ncbi:DNA alkylation repair protein [Enterococcus casseliflavus]|uniref:DNA alkylation repair protein n=1 Tax=Enterococcus casseliflavus TaxID=37734 RepID=UPI000DFA4250|nr:DNA alkylation repair protein [Enterococcus casseliflavus]GEB28025.1 DNA alkylation repair protein [Enterococcus casseliflavus]STP35716.1 DNA alkylation repair protein [Enterococcus casseliflavus]